jgi:RimJ/RimL family protein N-acetyltransferase
MPRLVTLRVYERRLDAPDPPSATPPGLEIRMLDAERASDLDSAWHPEAAQRFRDGQACAVACERGAIVAYAWLARTPVVVGEIDHVFVPGAEDVYIYDAFTASAWRGRRLFSAVTAALLGQGRAWGRRRAMIFVGAANHASRRAIERAGFELAHTVTRVELWGFTRLWFRGPRTARITLVREGGPGRSPGP